MPTLSPPVLIPPVWLIRALVRARDWWAGFHRRTAPPPLAILEALSGLVVHKALGLSVEFRIAECLADGPLPAAELSLRTGASEEALTRILRALSAVDIFRIEADGCYSNNAVSDCLRGDHLQSLRDVVSFFSSPHMWRLWVEAPRAMMGQPDSEPELIEAALGQASFFDIVNDDPATSREFNGAMAAMARINGPLLPRRFDFSSAKRLCDVGGGTGTVLCEILHGCPELEGVLYDLPPVVELADATIAAYGVGDRCRRVGGSFFESVPEGCDLYLLQAVLHDWGDAECAKILENIVRVLPRDGRVLLLEPVVPSRGGAVLNKLLDLQVMVTTRRGRERSVEELGSMGESVGLSLRRHFPLPTLLEVLEFVRS